MKFPEIIGTMIGAGFSFVIFYYLTRTYGIEVTTFQYLLIYQLFFMTNILMRNDSFKKNKE